MNRKQLSADLQRMIPRVMREMPASEVGLFIEALIRERTRQGNFLHGSSTKGYSKGHALKRARRGLPGSRVDLLFQGRMLAAMHSRARASTSSIRIEVGYLPAISEVNATRIAEYHNTLGAGRSRIIRRFIGLTDSEAQRIVTHMRRKFLTIPI
ncbi:MAG: hypothetical protein J0L94_01120 [Rhodothermia bacterium]|nr:hypothetical protein [Rhodothermia bacterium]